MMQPTPLPEFMTRSLDGLNSDWIPTYNRLRKLEARHFKNLKDRDKLIALRLLGHLFNELPNASSVDDLHRLIVSTVDDGEVVQLGKFYLKYFVATCEFFLASLGFTVY